MEQIEIQINDWKYVVRRFDRFNYDLEVIASPKKVQEIPNSLFKYYSINNYSLDALENSYIYAAHPAELNDIWDCNKNHLDVSDFVKNDISFQEFCSTYLYDKSIEEIKLDDYSLIKDFLYQLTYQTYGVLSTSKYGHNILMWSYYTGNSGFCIEFNTEKLKNTMKEKYKVFGPFPINYTKDFEPIKLHNIDIKLNLIYNSTTKFQDWDHENEWRILLSYPKEDMMETPFMRKKDFPDLKDRKFYYQNSNCIERILIGRHFLDYFNNEISVENGVVIIGNKSEENCKSFELKRKFVKFVSEHKIKTFILLPMQELKTLKSEFEYGEKELKIWLDENEKDRFYFKIIPD